MLNNMGDDYSIILDKNEHKPWLVWLSGIALA